ncbi:hypothetical protein H488_0107290 [Kocuria sp. UCD-OTCP]|nr:hypothetical protein H488_0107290 [Kocuria sp. UCD-OTCP]
MYVGEGSDMRPDCLFKYQVLMIHGDCFSQGVQYFLDFSLTGIFDLYVHLISVAGLVVQLSNFYTGYTILTH